jgi:hypothetical protein
VTPYSIVITRADRSYRLQESGYPSPYFIPLIVTCNTAASPSAQVVSQEESYHMSRYPKKSSCGFQNGASG